MTIIYYLIKIFSQSFQTESNPYIIGEFTKIEENWKILILQSPE